MGLFSDTPTAPPDPILSLNTLFKQDTHPGKISLGVGAYRTDDSHPYVLPVVRKVEQDLASDPDANHEYLPQDGLKEFTDLSAKLILGKQSKVIQDGKVVTVQALSGTGALRLGFTFIAKHLGSRQVYISKQTWSNHRNVVPQAGLPATKDYRYFDQSSNRVDIEGLIADISAAPKGSVIILHGCAHNPTGADPNKEEWKRILEVMKRCELIPFFDNAYQGFATGSLEEDAWSTRLFADSGLEMFVAQSYAKNMGMYGERVGALNVIMNSSDTYEAVRSQLKGIVRAMYSNPPIHGAKVAAEIMGNDDLMEEWAGELRMMAGRIQEMRVSLREALKKNGTPGNWDHIVNQIGMFSYTGMTSQQVKYLRERYHIYMTSNGRMSMAGLTTRTVDLVADAMKDAVTNVVKQD